MGFCQGQHATYKLKQDFINKQLDDAIDQIKILAQNTPEDLMPRTFEGDTLVTSKTNWWTSGFYPGTLVYLYEYSGDKKLLQLAQDKFKILEKEKYNKNTHDVGFMLYCSYGNALRITKDTMAYKDILLTGARSLITRYSPDVQAIRSWGGMKRNNPDVKATSSGGGWNYPVIIDNMMNLEFLLEVSKLGNDPVFWDIAVTHANTTMKNHFRPDYSCYHLVDYNPKDGSVIAKKTVQGAYDESAWARGQAWALYGFTMMYRETRDKKYLDFAKKIADFVLNHPNMPEDQVPYWDFDAPGLPDGSELANYKFNRDASTAAILASALIELSSFTKDTEQSLYISKAEKMLQSLSKEPYKAVTGTNGGFILKYSAGHLPKHSEVDVPLTYADYYYVEALMRYRNLLLAGN